MNWLKWVGAVVAISVLLLALSIEYGRRRWERLTTSLVADLNARAQPLRRSQVHPAEFEGLPEPVQRYLRLCLTEGMAKVTAVSMRQRGTFNLSETAQTWKPFEADQHVRTQAPGFVWNARMTLLPGLRVYVHDAYVAGEGILHPALAGLITLVELRGGGDIAQGELMRYLAEAPWYPTALLPGQGVHWDAVDGRRARATLKDGDISASLLFTFGQDGFVESVGAEARGRTVSGKVIPTPWEGRWSNYQKREGMVVPLSGEVAWLLPEGRKPYWRGSITHLAYRFES